MGRIILWCIILINVWITKGFDAFWDIVNNLAIATWFWITSFNQIAVVFFGESILTILFKGSITFALVGLLLEFLFIKRGSFGKFFGKVSFWIIGFPVSFALDFIASKIF